jgi:hypothetical protein
LDVAAEAEVVEGHAAVERAAVIPHQEVADAPAVNVLELALAGEREKLVDQAPGLVVRHADDVTGVGSNEEVLAAGLRDCANQRLGDGVDGLALAFLPVSVAEALT